jgi:hypothetical protein
MEALHCLQDTIGLRVSYDSANAWLYNQWRGPHDEGSIKIGAHLIYDCLTQVPCSKILSDHSEVIGNWQGAAPWVGRHYFDNLAERGVTHFAWVYAPGYYDRVAMERSCFFLTRPVVAIFHDLAAAYYWLQRNPPPRK